jgi:hypothetical protein
VKERIEIYEDLRQHGMENIEKKRLNFLDIMLECNSENQITMEQIRDEIDTFMVSRTSASILNDYSFFSSQDTIR